MANLGFFVSLLTSQASVLNLEPIKMNESISTSSFQNSWYLPPNEGFVEERKPDKNTCVIQHEPLLACPSQYSIFLRLPKLPESMRIQRFKHGEKQ